MAGEYQNPQIIAAANELAAEAYAELQASNPTWEPRPTKASRLLVDAIAAMLAVQHDRFLALADVSAETVFKLQGTPRIEPVAAAAVLTVTASTTVGDRVLAAGTLYEIAAADGTTVYAEQTVDVTIADGDAATEVGGVIVRVLDESAVGAAGNGYGGGGVTLVAPVYTWVSGVSVATATSGGVDGQTTSEYLDYAARKSRGLTVQPIRRGEWAPAALEHAGIGRAAEIPLYNADTSTANVPLHYTVPVAGLDGLAVSSTIRNEVRDTHLATLGGVTVHVVNFNYTTVNAAVDYTPRGTADDAAVQAAVAAFLDPLVYGLPAVGEVQPVYDLLSQVYYRDLIGAIDQLDCVSRVNTVFLATGSTTPTTQQDVALAGVAPLPVAGTISVTHT